MRITLSCAGWMYAHTITVFRCSLRIPVTGKLVTMCFTALYFTGHRVALGHRRLNSCTASQEEVKGNRSTTILQYGNPKPHRRMRMAVCWPTRNARSIDLNGTVGLVIRISRPASPQSLAESALRERRLPCQSILWRGGVGCRWGDEEDV